MFGLTYKHHYRRVIAVCIFCSLTFSWASQTLADDFTQAMAPVDSMYYEHGKTAAWEETSGIGPFFTGVAFGIGIPFVGGASAAAAHKVSGRYGDLAGLLMGITGSAFWTWGGSRLTHLSSIDVPEEHLSGLDGMQVAAFSRGYHDGYERKRQNRYTGGVIVGAMIPVIAVLYIASQITTLGGV